MDIGTATALTRYTYQTTLAAKGQDAAILQAFGDAIGSLATLSGGSEALGSLASGMHTLAGADGDRAFQAVWAATDAAPASGLFVATPDGGFDPAVNLNATLALAAYANRQAGIPATTPRAAALNASQDPAQPAQVQAALQAAQTALAASTLNLLA